MLRKLFFFLSSLLQVSLYHFITFISAQINSHSKSLIKIFLLNETYFNFENIYIKNILKIFNFIKYLQQNLMKNIIK